MEERSGKHASGEMKVPSSKSQLRRQLRAALATLSPTERESQSKAVCRMVLESTVWKQSNTPLLYAPLPDELDVTPLWSAALAAGKTLALPRFNAAENLYVAAQVTQPDRDLVPGHYGVREPGPQCPHLPLNRLDLVMAPGLGFAPGGRRLGRGKGYYDRLLAGLQALKCGVGYDVQWLDSIPQEPCDVLLDCILTPGRGFVWSSARF
jgi:5-formyltetrahydrofolate cyclo-ligase